MAFNIRKATLQRTFESVLKAVRSNTNPYGVDLPSKDDVTGKRKLELVSALNAAEVQVYEASRFGTTATSERVKKYNDGFEQQLQTVAEQFGLTFKPPGTTLRA
jgi:hypothetical protein